ncbi:MAG TPA: hypothetical protein VHA07_09100 [Devosia sp.]|nr:hypothetical protein [Devosia sp.]
MKPILIVAALSLMVTGAIGKTIANPPTAAQLKTFYETCLKIAPSASVLCKCKEDAAPRLIDTAFMDVVIASMKGKPLDAKYYDDYNNYIARSNQICKPDYM